MRLHKDYWPDFWQSMKIGLAIGLLPTILFSPKREFFWVGVLCFSIPMSLMVAFKTCYLLPKYRKKSFVAALVLTSLTYFCIVFLTFLIGILLSNSIVEGLWPWDPKVIDLLRHLATYPPIIFSGVFCFIIMCIVTFVLQISRKLGPGVMGNWMRGYYHTPREEERIFMFLDMKDSTTHAENLGNMRFSRLVQDFLGDLTDPVLATKGEVSHYIGDEAVLTWRIAEGTRNQNCLSFFFRFRDVIESRAEHYREAFGFVPAFKAGAHVGSVVTTQVGESKSEIVFHGDVLNTAARIQSLCNELGEQFLISRELLTRLGLELNSGMVSLGEHELKGKAQRLELVAIQNLESSRANLLNQGLQSAR